ncbi:MAG: hypothetical protein ACXVCL_16325, partial [Bdellovibrio sp.]
LLKDLNREHIGDKTCYGKFVKLNQARKAFFLNSENPQAIKKLSELYKEMNLPINASFFRSLLNEDDKGKNYLVELFNSTEKTKIDDSKEANNIVNERATIYASRINEKHPFVQHVVEQIDKLSSSSDQSARNKALNTAILLGPRGYRFVKKLSSDKASEIKDKATNQITLIENYPFDYNYPDSQKFWDN